MTEIASLTSEELGFEPFDPDRHGPNTVLMRLFSDPDEKLGMKAVPTDATRDEAIGAPWAFVVAVDAKEVYTCKGCGEPFDRKADEEYCEKCAAKDEKGSSAPKEDPELPADEKAGRRVRQDKLTLVERIQSELGDLGRAVADFVGWAKYDEAAPPTPTEFIAEPTGEKVAGEGVGVGGPLQEDGGMSLCVCPECGTELEHDRGIPCAEVPCPECGTMMGGQKDTEKDTPEASVKSLEGTKSRAFSFKAADGSDWWMQWTTNAFRDREHEIFTTKALTDFVARHADEDVKGEFWYRHIRGTKFADVKWQAMSGRFLVQAGPFDDTEVGRAFKEFFAANPNGHPVVAPDGWGTSHGYYYNAEDRKDNVYDWVEIKESTVLPSGVAANPWSPMPTIIKRSKEMDAKEEKDLLAIGGQSLVDVVRDTGATMTKDLEGSVAFKEVSPGTLDMFVAVADMIEGEARDALLVAIDQLTAEAEVDAMPEEEIPMEAVMEADVAGVDMSMPAVEEGKSTEAEVKSADPTNPITREEIATAMNFLGEKMRDDILAAVTGAVKTVIEPVTARLDAMEQADSTKIAAKIEQTPAASLSQMLQSVRDNKAAHMAPGDPLGLRKPTEAQPTAQPGAGGLPSFLQSMIGGS